MLTQAGYMRCKFIIWISFWIVGTITVCGNSAAQDSRVAPAMLATATATVSPRQPSSAADTTSGTVRNPVAGPDVRITCPEMCGPGDRCTIISGRDGWCMPTLEGCACRQACPVDRAE